MWLSYVLIGSVRALLGATPRWVGSRPEERQRIYFANHSSHIDTVALWSALPPDLRAKTRTAAAADYWGTSALKRMIALKALNATLIDRNRADPQSDPLRPLYEVLDAGQSIIIFPEGTRQAQPLPGPSSPAFITWRGAFLTSSLFRSISTTCIAACRRGRSFPFR
jgi:1-acyl-sn-glycerol-3-phosphate acyltransferase